MILYITDSIHTEAEEYNDATTWNGNEKHDNGFAN